MSVNKFIKELNGNRAEGEIIKSIFYSLLTSFIFLTVVYYLKLKNIDGVVGKYGFYLFFAALSYSLIIASVRQIRAYKEFPCMSGMMIGMISGMIAGFLPGLYIGATNGMFVGATAGMLIGIIMGIWNGKCCGIMGVMEGIMAGFMGSLMGAMTAIMMLNDNLKYAVVISFAVTSFTMLCLNYLVYFEMKESDRQRKDDHFLTIVLSLLLMAGTTWLMIFGPRSALFS
jgi:hypothetical protein